MKNWLFVMLLLLVGTARAAEPSYDSYGNWFVACDNRLSCEARGFADDR
ncbi:hypothetical protein MSKU15_0011 [Komagataeibacter diospyri]|nr:hypothetical protein MSKU15_0011 [Komagataeibacter diospyri]